MHLRCTQAFMHACMTGVAMAFAVENTIALPEQARGKLGSVIDAECM